VFIAPSVATIEILSTLEYSSQDALRIVGRGQTVKTEMNTTLLAVTDGADLTIVNLDFEGRGDFSINSRGDIGQEAGKGIFVDVREDQTGVVRVVLSNVSVSGVANHGIHVSDCSLADDCGAGAGGGGSGSPASIALTCHRCSVDNVGNGKFDADGVRIDDRGAGDIVFAARDSSFTNVGADGVELDEGDEGDVRARIRGSVFSDNGAYCDPVQLAPFLPDPDEAEFAEADAVTEDQIPPAVTGTNLDDACIEREVSFFDSGFVEEYEFGIDLDDGIDFDEAGAGSLAATLRDSTISGNLDEGVDFDEAGAGSARVRYFDTEAFDNNDDGFKLSEEDAGGVAGIVRGASATGNGGKGFVFEEESDGNLFVSVIRSRSAGNDDTGIEAVQEDAGTGKLVFRRSDIADGIDTEGVDQL